MSADTDMTILAIDPSTEKTGLAVVRFDTKGNGTVLLTECLTSVITTAGVDDPTRLAERIRSTATQMRSSVTRLQAQHFVCLDLIAYEMPPPPRPGFLSYQSIAALNQAVGAYTILEAFDGLRRLPVYIASCKAVFGNRGLALAANADRKAKEAKRVQLKANAILWANETFGLSLTDGDDGIADALSVAVAAYRIVRKEQDETLRKAQQKALFGAGSRGPRKTATRSVSTTAAKTKLAAAMATGIEVAA